MNVRRRDNPSKGDLGKPIKGAVTQRKGSEGQAKAIQGSKVVGPKSTGYKKIKGSVSG